MIRILVGMFCCVAFMLPTEASAGRRCYYRTYQTIYSLNGWNHSCYSCHKRENKQKGWRDAMTEIAGRHKDNQDFYASLQVLLESQVTGQPGVAQYGTVQSHGVYPQAYPMTTTGFTAQYSSYPITGQTMYGPGVGGVQSYQVNPLVDLGSLYNLHAKSVQQIAASSHQAVTDQADLVQQQAEYQASVAKINAARDALVAVAAQPGEVRSFRVDGTQVTSPAPMQTEVIQQQSTVPQQPQANVAPQVTPPQQQGTLLDYQSILINKCSECHSGDSSSGGFDVSNFTLQQFSTALDRIDLPPDNPKAMPRKHDGDKMTHGEPLTREEKYILQDFYYKSGGK